MSEFDYDHMTGAELKVWRHKYNYTQRELCLTLEIKSPQTIISYEKSTNVLPRTFRLALMALESLPDRAYGSVGHRERNRNRSTSPK
jgi:DNA-binding XRE family transcriptional regulator